MWRNLDRRGRRSLQLFSKILHSVPKYAIINPERRWIYEGTQDNQSHTVRLDIQHESLSCGLPLAVRTERKYYARHHTYRTLPSESVVLALMADYPLLAAHATEATDIPKDHLQPRAPRNLRTSVRYLLYAFWKLVLIFDFKSNILPNVKRTHPLGCVLFYYVDKGCRGRQPLPIYGVFDILIVGTGVLDGPKKRTTDGRPYK